MLLKSITAVFFLIASTASASQLAGGYQQCGGYNHNGPTHCERGYHCERLNDYFSQCLPGQGHRTTSYVPIPTATRAPIRSAAAARITASPVAPQASQTHTQAAPQRTPSVPSHLVDFARRQRERREREREGENSPAATQSIGEMVLPMYPQPTQTLTPEDIDQINLLDDIEREILRYSRYGGVSPGVPVRI